MRFRDRQEAGRLLATRLKHYIDYPGLLILALPRGGVPVAFEVAKVLHAPLEVFLVRKLGVPAQEELAMGAIATGGFCFLNEPVVQAFTIPAAEIQREVELEQQELERREHLYRDHRPPVEVRDRPLILIDDGIATGSTLRVAVQALKQQFPTRLVIAVPIGPQSACEALRSEVDELICLVTPDPFHAVGQGYRSFPQTTDEEVQTLLKQANWNPPSSDLAPCPSS